MFTSLLKITFTKQVKKKKSTDYKPLMV